MNTVYRKLTALMMITLIAGLILSACSSEPFWRAETTATPLSSISTPGKLTAEGIIIPVRSTVMGFPAGGELSEILVSEGQEVHKGDVLARMSGLEALEAALSQAKLEQLSALQALDDLAGNTELMRTQSAQSLLEAKRKLLEAQKALNHLDTKKYHDELDDLIEAVDEAKDEVSDSKERLNKHQDLDPENSTRKNAQKEYDDAELEYEDAIYNRDLWQNQLDLAKAAVDLAQAWLDDAQEVFDNNQNGPDPDNLAIAEARLDNANAQVTAAQLALKKIELVAPYDALVVDVNDIDPGESMAPGSMVVILADYSQWIVETHDLSELDVVEVTVGQKVSVTVDALPEVKLPGVIDSIDRLFIERRGNIVYTVHIHLEEIVPLLRWGMTATATFE